MDRHGIPVCGALGAVLDVVLDFDFETGFGEGEGGEKGEKGEEEGGG